MVFRPVLRAVLAGLTIILVVTVMAMAFLFHTVPGREHVRRLLVARLGNQVTGRITIARLGGDLPNEVVLHDVALADSAGSLVFRADRLAARVSVVQLFSKRIDVSRMELERPTLVLRHRRGGAWNVARVFARDDRDASDTGGRGFGHWVRIADARVSGARVIVRMPWPADSEAVRGVDDSAAVTERARARVERTPDGVEQVMEFRDIDAAFPRVLLAHPDTARIIAEVARASMMAEPFQPPAADIRDLGGTLVVTSDSLHFVGWRVVFPDSRMTVQVQYAPTTGALRGRLRADPLAFRDLQWLYPLLPAEGRGAVTIDAVRDTSGPMELRATDIVAEVGGARAAGTLALAVGDTVRLTDADVRITALDTELARRLLPRFRLPIEGTLDARARAERTAGGFATHAALTFRDRRGGTSRVTARGMLTVGETVGARDLRVDLAPLDAAVIRALAPRARVRGALSGPARVTGTTGSGWRVTGDVSHVDRGTRSRFIGTAAVSPGTDAFEVDGRVAPLSLDAVGRFAPGFGLHGSASGRVRAAVTGDSLAFRTMLRVDAGTVAANGRVSWAGPGVSYDVRVEPQGLDPRAVSARAPEGVLNGTLSVRGEGTDRRTMRTELSAALDDVRLDRISFDSVRLAMRTADGVAAVDTLGAWHRTARLSAAGTVGLVADRAGELRYSAEVDSLGTLLRGPRPTVASATGRAGTDADGTGAAPEPAPAEYTGHGNVRGTARGNVRSLRLNGDASLGALVAGARGAAHAGARYTLGIGRDDTVAVAATVDSARLGRVVYERAELRAAGTRRRLVADARVRQRAEMELLAHGVISLDTTVRGAPTRAGVLELRELAARLPSGEWRSARATSVVWRAGALDVDSLVLRGTDSAAITFTGRLPASGDGAIDLRLHGVPLADISALRQSNDEVDGRLASTIRVAGTTGSPRGIGSATVTGLVVRGDSLPDVRASLAYADRRLAAAAEIGGNPFALATANAELPIDLALTGVSGARLARHAPLLLDIRADSLPLTALPRRDSRDTPARTTSAAVRIDSGWARGEVTVRGTLDRPGVTGRVDVRGGMAFVPAAGITVRDIVGTGRLTNDSLVIDSVVARSNGAVRASGVLIRAPGSAHRVIAALSARDAEVIGGSRGVIHADADLALSGTTDSLLVTGRAEVLHGFVERKGPGEHALHVAATGDPELFALIDTSAVGRRRSTPHDAGPRRTLHADLTVRIDPGVWYRSAPNAKVEVFTPRDLRIRGDLLADDAAAGGVVLTRGGVYVFRLRPFAIVRGGATLAGAGRVAPLVQATGEHEVWIVGRGMLPVRFIASGFPNDVQFSLGDASVLPAAPPDVGSYLSLGRPPVSLLQTESSSLSGLSTSGARFTGELGALVRRQQVSPALGAVLYQLAKGARDAVGVRLFTVTPTDLPPELAESKFGGLHGTTLESGYLFGSRTYFGARIRLSAVSPGVVVVHSFRPDLQLRAAYEPLFRLGAAPTLGPPQHGELRRALGAFLTKEWWF